MIIIDFTIKPNPKLTIPDYVIDEFGNKVIRDKNGQYHSYNGLPSVVCPDGSKLWHNHGLRHRDNGLPAVIWSVGKNEYWENGIHIRTENP